MIKRDRANNKGADLRFFRLKILRWTHAAHLVQPNRKMQWIHLVGQRAMQPPRMAGGSVNLEHVLRRISGRKERQTLDVIPMGVGKKERSFDRLSGCFFDQLFSKE